MKSAASLTDAFSGLFPVESGGLATIFPGIVPKLHQPLTYLATIGTDAGGMQFLAMISILALLTVSGAVISDGILTADQHVAQGVR